MSVRRVSEDEWPMVRVVRLRALTEGSPVSAAVLAREQRFTEQHWRSRIRTSATWVGFDEDQEPRGIVSMINEPGSPADDRHVVGLWVAQEVRRRGLGWALLDAVRAAAGLEGATTLSVWVADGDLAAGDLYVRAGFERTGERHLLARDPERIEERWLRRLMDDLT
ncbi:MAG: GNAT family N-acetyltransferase [Actinobacteria bacterium]|nr:GNAT family N-acetyltransferase [Actinomycetota bacterium]